MGIREFKFYLLVDGPLRSSTEIDKTNRQVRLLFGLLFLGPAAQPRTAAARPAGKK
jgi:hypothetical protein